MNERCIMVTPKLKELASQLPDEPIEVVKGLVELWQTKNNKDWDTIPTLEEINKFEQWLRSPDNSMTSEEMLAYTFRGSSIEITNSESQNAFDVTLNATIEDQDKVNTEFDPQTRKDRVDLIARLFSQNVSKELAIHTESLKNRIDAAEEEGDSVAVRELRNALKKLNRLKIISILKPVTIFENIKKHFSQYTSDTDEGRIQAELDVINSMKGAEKYSDEQKYEAAKKKAIYKNIAYTKILNNFNALALQTIPTLKFNEGIVFDPNGFIPKETLLDEDEIEGDENDEIGELKDESAKEETYKDGWMSNYREVPSSQHLSEEVRKAIRGMVKLDYNGRPEKDDLGNIRYLDSEYVHAVLVDKLDPMLTADEMIPILETLSTTKPWVKQIIFKLKNDPKLFSQFYHGFRLDSTHYWIQTKEVKPDGTYILKTVPINWTEGIQSLLDEWRYNYETGTPLDEDSIYDTVGNLIKENAAKGLAWTQTLNNKFNNLSTEERIELLKEDRIWNTLNKLLNMISVSPNQGILMNALTNIKTGKGITYTDPVMLLLTKLNIIFKGVVNGDVKSKTNEDGTEEKGDLLNTFKSAYSDIAEMISEVSEGTLETSARQGDKTRYSHTRPNYLGKLIKQLRNDGGDEAKFMEFIEREFKPYPWFYKDGIWLNDVLDRVVNDPAFRKEIRHKVVLESDKTEYKDWDDLAYSLVLLAEYFGDPENTTSDTKFGNYAHPILSDSTSGEFIRLQRYTNNSVMGADKKYRKYDDIIIDKLINLVNQELNRIALVNERDAKYEAELEHAKSHPGYKITIVPKESYDIKREEKDGKRVIVSKGGSEFKFIPALNTYTTADGKSFIEKIAELTETGTGADLRNFLTNTLHEIMESEFEKAYQEWYDTGLLDELPNGKYKHLGVIGVHNGQSQYNKVTASALSKAKKLLGSQWSVEMDTLLGDYNRNNPIIDRKANILLNTIKGMLNTQVQEGNISLKEVEHIIDKLVVRNNAKEKLREYFWNSTFATSQIIQLSTTDLAFYPNLGMFYKRIKEVHSPSLRLNTSSKYGRKEEKTIILKDQKIVSTMIDEIKTVLNDRVIKGEMLARDRDYIVNKFKSVNVTDAQAYRSLSSYRAVLDMIGEWDEDMQKAFDNFESGHWDMSDFMTIWQTKKPFLYTQIGIESGIDSDIKIKTPVQHKNSEFLLLAIHQLVAGPLGRSTKLTTINKFMEVHGIDVVQFESSSKVSNQGVIDLSDANTEDEINRTLTKAIYKQEVIIDNNGNESYIITDEEDSNYLQTVSYEEYGIQTETPEHAIDATQLVGTQIRKLITADISDDAIIEVDGLKKTKQEWLKLYNAINTENIIQSFVEIDELFKNPKEIERVLLQTIRGSNRYGTEMITACTLDENGEFNIPLSDPVISQSIQNILNSIIKKTITKQKIKGGALIQVSDYGLTDELSIVFKDREGNKLNWESYHSKHPKASRKEYEDFVNNARKEGSLAIAYFECYMPAYSEQFHAPLMKKGTHELDINKLPESLRKAIGYRLPTEDKYSMAPLYIKGFLPQQNGSAIMLPAEITTISDSDFDVDKLYVMLPEFDVIPKYNKKQFVKDLVNQLIEGKQLTNEALREYEDIIYAAIDEGRTAPEDSQAYSIWQTYKNNREKYRVTSEDKLKKVEYDHNKDPKDNSTRARNNLLIDLMWGILTNTDTASKILASGGSGYQERAKNIIIILQESKESELRRELSIPDNQTVLNVLENLHPKKLGELASRYEKELNPLSPRTQVRIHQQMMMGAALISIVANHNANHALMQHTQLGIEKLNGAFQLNGTAKTSLHDIKNSNGEFISKNNAGYLAASVDNGKNPVLSYLNLNTFTCDAALMLSRLGYTPIEVGLLMTQPIIVDITTAYFRRKREGDSKDSIIEDIIKNYKEKAKNFGDTSFSDYKTNKFLASDLADNILIEKEVKEMNSKNSTSNIKKATFYSQQVSVGYLFKKIMATSEVLSQLVQATRADTSNGAAGPTIGDSHVKIQKVLDLYDKVAFAEVPVLVGADVLLPLDITGLSIDKIREKILDAPLPFLQAFYTLGLQETQRMLGNYFPYFNTSFREIIEGNDKILGIRQYTKYNRLNAKTINNIYNDLLVYIMSNTSFFGTDKITSENKRKEFINNFPTYYREVLNRNPQIANLEFIKGLKILKANKYNPVEVIEIKGKLSANQKETYTRDWESLLYMGTEAQSLAVNLFRYSSYRNGFGFGPKTFVHLAPNSVRQAVPEYIETLRGLINNNDDYTQFIEQYIFNHLYNRQLVPEIPAGSTIKFENEEHVALDEVIISLGDNPNPVDRKVIKSEQKIGNSKLYVYFNYIARRYKGGMIYYRLDKYTANNEARYERIEPLGYKNSFIEYEYGVNAMDMKSVIERNKKDYVPYKMGKVVIPTDSESDYNNIPDYVQHDFSSLNADDIPSVAFKEVYNSALEQDKGNTNDINNFSPNTNFKDANDEEICGGNVIKEY